MKRLALYIYLCTIPTITLAVAASENCSMIQAQHEKCILPDGTKAELVHNTDSLHVAVPLDKAFTMHCTLTPTQDSTWFLIDAIGITNPKCSSSSKIKIGQAFETSTKKIVYTFSGTAPSKATNSNVASLFIEHSGCELPGRGGNCPFSIACTLQ